MIYKIYCDGELIAEFLHEPDRDLCLSALQEAYEDVTMSKESK